MPRTPSSGATLRLKRGDPLRGSTDVAESVKRMALPTQRPWPRMDRAARAAEWCGESCPSMDVPVGRPFEEWRMPLRAPSSSSACPIRTTTLSSSLFRNLHRPTYAPGSMRARCGLK